MTADRVLCALPFSVLRNIELPASFSERKLEHHQESRIRLSVARVSAGKEALVGGKGTQWICLTSEAVEIWQPTWNQPGPRGILMTYNRPGQAERIAGMKESERISSTLTQLGQWFPGLQENFERGATKCWIEDEWARGAWSFVGPRDYEAASSPAGRIHFAGEHLSQWSSWMQGALDSVPASGETNQRNSLGRWRFRTENRTSQL